MAGGLAKPYSQGSIFTDKLTRWESRWHMCGPALIAVMVSGG